MIIIHTGNDIFMITDGGYKKRIPMQSEAKRGNPVDARHSSAHSHSSTFRKYWGIHCGQVYKCTECILRGPIVFSGQCNIPLSSIIVSVIETPQEWWSQLCFWSEFLHSGGFPSEPVLCRFPAKKIIIFITILLLFFTATIILFTSTI